MFGFLSRHLLIDNRQKYFPHTLAGNTMKRNRSLQFHHMGIKSLISLDIGKKKKHCFRKHIIANQRLDRF